MYNVQSFKKYSTKRKLPCKIFEMRIDTFHIWKPVTKLFLIVPDLHTSWIDKSKYAEQGHPLISLDSISISEHLVFS